MGRSQISIEFIFALGMIFFIFLVIFGFMINRNTELIESGIKLDKERTCLLISSLLTSAFVSGNGIIINESTDYNASINSTDISGNYKGLNVEGTYCLLAINTVPNAKLREGSIRIENRNGYIDIKNV